MADEPSYILDVQGIEPADAPANAPAEGRAGPAGRAWIGMHFECCGVYTRIYRNRKGTAYEGFCPRCQRVAHIRIGSGGTSHRIFRAT